MPIDGTVTRSSTGAHLVAARDANGNLTTTPAFPTLAGGTPITLLSGSPNLATVTTKLNEIITRLNTIIAATGLSA